MTATRTLVPLFDLRLSEGDRRAVLDTLESGWLTMGPRTQEWEAVFAEHLGVRHAIALSSCTAALHLAYLAVGIGPGDEVIVPSFTFAATASAVLYCGGEPVFADIASLDEPQLDLADVEARITERTRAVCVVHYGGYGADVGALRALCRQRGLALVEDAAHAPSATREGRKLGTWGAAGCFSFFSNKVLSAGEGGMLATDDDDVAAAVRALRSHGMTSGSWERHSGRAEGYDIARVGFNYRLDESRSALLTSRLQGLEEDIARRRDLVREYRARLGAVAGVRVPFGDAEVETSSCYVMPVFLEDAGRRDEVRRRLREEHAVQTSVLYPGVHEFTAYRERNPSVSLPRTEAAAAAQLTLPLFPHMTREQLDQVLEGLEEVLSSPG